MHKLLLTGVSVIALSLGAATTAGAVDLMFPKGQGDFNWDSLQKFADAHKDLAGQNLTIWDAWNDPAGDKAQWEAVLAYFTDATGVTVQDGSSKNYEEQARIDIQAGSPACSPTSPSRASARILVTTPPSSSPTTSAPVRHGPVSASSPAPTGPSISTLSPISRK